MTFFFFVSDGSAFFRKRFYIVHLYIIGRTKYVCVEECNRVPKFYIIITEIEYQLGRKTTPTRVYGMIPFLLVSNEARVYWNI